MSMGKSIVKGLPSTHGDHYQLNTTNLIRHAVQTVGSFEFFPRRRVDHSQVRALYTFKVSSAVGVDTESRAMTRTVVGPRQPSTETWARLMRMDAWSVANVFFPKEISVIFPGAIFVEIDGDTDAEAPMVAPGTPLMVTPTLGPAENPRPRVAPSDTSTWQPTTRNCSRTPEVTGWFPVPEIFAPTRAEIQPSRLVAALAILLIGFTTNWLARNSRFQPSSVVV